jgi:hypothetical protein
MKTIANEDPEPLIELKHITKVFLEDEVET